MNGPVFSTSGLVKEDPEYGGLYGKIQKRYDARNCNGCRSHYVESRIMKENVVTVLSWLTQLRPEQLSLVFTGIGSLAASIAVYRWRTDQRWKRKEALFSFLDGFLETPGAQNAMMMLHTRSREVPLWDNGTPEQRYMRVTWENVASAFAPDNVGELPSEPIDTAIRDSFGDFFGRLNRLQMMVEERLFYKHHAAFIMKHWVAVFKRDYNEIHMRNIRIFLHSNDYSRVKDLFKSFDLDFDRSIDTDVESFRADGSGRTS